MWLSRELLATLWQHDRERQVMLRVRLFADDTLVAESDDPELWAKVFTVMEAK